MQASEIQDKVREIVADSMRVPVEKVAMTTMLVDELGAESIDFIDMLTNLEHAFSVEFCEQGMFAKLDELFGEGELSIDGRLTELGATVMRERRPEIDPSRFRAGLPVTDLNALFTTQTWLSGLVEVLQARPSACGSCGASDVVATKGSKIVCNACDASTPCPTQADVLERWHAEYVRR